MNTGNGSLAFSHDALPGRVLFGAGVRRQLGEELAALGSRRVLLIASARDRALCDEIAEALGALVVGRCARVVQHVPRPCAEEARTAFVAADADTIVTLGGGSAIGLGKAVALTQPTKLVTIPTTYAGSEMTPIWGMSDGDRKETGRDLRVLPQLVLYDPELTLSLPPEIAGPSAFNALAHCAEATYAPGADPITALLALEGLRAITEALPVVMQRPEDLSGRSLALYGAYLAGRALAVSGTALHHKTCHVLGGLFHLGHGEMNAVLLPYALRYNEPAIPNAHDAMCRALGADNAADALRRLAVAIGVPTSLSEIGMPEDGIDVAVPRVVTACRDNIRPPDEASIRALLSSAFAGDWKMSG